MDDDQHGRPFSVPAPENLGNGWPGAWHPYVHGEPVEDWGHPDCRICEAARARDVMMDLESPSAAAEQMTREAAED